MPRKSAHDWTVVDWSLPTKTIAQQLGCSSGCVSTARGKHAPESSMAVAQHSRPCVICGTLFACPPSAKNSTCSPACRSERARRHSARPRPWSDAAKAKLAARARTPNLALGTPSARLSPIAGPFETNQEAKIWQVIDANGTHRTIRNLRRTLINELGEIEGMRVERILATMSSVIRKGGVAWITRCGWTLTALPEDPEQDIIANDSLDGV